MIMRRPIATATQITAAMSYLGILALVPLVLGKIDPFVRFHARQGVVLWIWEVLAVFSLVIPGVGRVFFQVSSLLCFVLSVVGLVAVFLGRTWRFPFVGQLAEKL
ncbi:MAG: hypothetical protein HW380_1213 [Magnetococcales bacterium]|nr:hypothetical protein [Magnetococcales bacterium]HIJ83867.1 hypothetical protein [Magnetococcales bacterium]